MLPDHRSYHEFLRTSKAEWSVAKHGYVAGRTGWFSCRTACYLALGRPAVVQETGWSEFIPAGDGLLAFSTLEEAADAHRRHQRPLRRAPGRRARAGRAIFSRRKKFALISSRRRGLGEVSCLPSFSLTTRSLLLASRLVWYVVGISLTTRLLEIVPFRSGSPSPSCAAADPLAAWCAGAQYDPWGRQQCRAVGASSPARTCALGNHVGERARLTRSAVSGWKSGLPLLPSGC